MAHRSAFIRGYGQVNRRNLGSLKGHQLEELRNDKKSAVAPTSESFTLDETKHAEAYAKAAAAGRVAVIGADRKGYAMSIDDKLAAAEAGSDRVYVYLANLHRTLDALIATLPAPDHRSIHSGADYPVTGWQGTTLPTPAQPLTMPEAVDAGLLAPDMGYAFYEGPVPGVEPHADDGWTPATRQMARDLLRLQGDSGGYPGELGPPDTIFTDNEQPPRAQQEQPPRGEQ